MKQSLAETRPDEDRSPSGSLSSAAWASSDASRFDDGDSPRATEEDRTRRRKSSKKRKMGSESGSAEKARSRRRAEELDEGLLPTEPSEGDDVLDRQPLGVSAMADELTSSFSLSPRRGIHGSPSSFEVQRTASSPHLERDEPSICSGYEPHESSMSTMEIDPPETAKRGNPLLLDSPSANDASRNPVERSDGGSLVDEEKFSDAIGSRDPAGSRRRLSLDSSTCSASKSKKSRRDSLKSPNPSFEGIEIDEVIANSDATRSLRADCVVNEIARNSLDPSASSDESAVTPRGDPRVAARHRSKKETLLSKKKSLGKTLGEIKSAVEPGSPIAGFRKQDHCLKKQGRKARENATSKTEAPCGVGAKSNHSAMDEDAKGASISTNATNATSRIVDGESSPSTATGRFPDKIGRDGEGPRRSWNQSKSDSKTSLMSSDAMDGDTDAMSVDVSEKLPRDKTESSAEEENPRELEPSASSIRGASASSSRTTRRAARKANERIVARESIIVDEYSKKKKKDKMGSIHAAETSKSPSKATNLSSSKTSLAKNVSARNPSNKNASNRKSFHANASNKNATENQHVEGEGEHWVQCDRCMKWRLLPSSVKMDELPERWYCELNTHDSKRNSCDAPEQTTEEIANRTDAEHKDRRARSAGPRQANRKSHAESKSAHKVSPSESKSNATAVENAKESNANGRPRTDGHAKKDEVENETSEGKGVELELANSNEESVVAENTTSAEHVPEKGNSFRSPTKKNLLAKDEHDSVDDLESNAIGGKGGERMRDGKDLDGSKKEAKDEMGAETGVGSQEWVQCEKCEKWRKLPLCIFAKNLPDIWYCSMNTWDVNSAFCEAEEDKVEINARDIALLGINSNAPGSSLVLGKLSYRSLIYGSGRKYSRPTSERARAAESLFAHHADEALDGPPTFTYATSCAYLAKSITQKNHKSRETDEPGSFLESMADSRLWNELYGENMAGTAYLEYVSDNSLLSEAVRVADDGAERSDNHEALKALVCQSLEALTSSVAEVTLDCRRRSSRANLACAPELVTVAIEDLLREGLVEVSPAPPADTSREDPSTIDRRVVRYRCARSSKRREARGSMKLLKPWKNRRGTVAGEDWARRAEKCLG